VPWPTSRATTNPVDVSFTAGPTAALDLGLGRPATRAAWEWGCLRPPLRGGPAAR
jgi:hypothetical protein